MPETRDRPKRGKRRTRLTRQQKVLLLIAILLAVALAAVAGWKSLFVRPEAPEEETEDAETVVDYGEGVRPKAGGQRKSEDWYTVLILGRDTGGGGNTDTMLLASYDVTNQKATVMSIPRDTMVNVSWDVKKINSIYNANGGIGDSGRMKVQQDFLKAVLQQLMKPENILNIGKIAKVFQENVETDLRFQEILWFGRQALLGGLEPENVEFLTMPWRGANAYSRTESKRLGRYTELAYVTPVAGELLDIVNDKLSPFVETFTLRDLDIMSVNADGSLSSTTGRVEDSRAAQPPVKPQETPVETPGEEPPAGEAPPAPADETTEVTPEEAPGESPDPPAAEEPVEPPVQPPEAPAEEPEFTIIAPPAAE